MLIILHHHELIETVADTQASDIVLEGRGVHSACKCTHTEEKEARQTDDVEISRLVSLELEVEVLEIVFLDRAAIVEALKLLRLWVYCLVLGGRGHFTLNLIIQRSFNLLILTDYFLEKNGFIERRCRGPTPG